MRKVEHEAKGDTIRVSCTSLGSDGRLGTRDDITFVHQQSRKKK